MLRIKRFLVERAARFALKQEMGQTLVEYGMIVVLLAVVVVSILTVMGQDVVDLFAKASSDFQEINNRTP